MTEYFICILAITVVAVYKDYLWHLRDDKNPNDGFMGFKTRDDWEIYLWFRITLWSAVSYVSYRILFFFINYVLDIWGF